jgi:hypothetical protein
MQVHLERGVTEEQSMSKDQLLQELADAYERTIAAASESSQHGPTAKADTWGPREIIAHMAGWEVIASVRIPRIVAGMPPIEFADEAQQTVMDDAINAALVAMIGEQSLGAICSILRRAYQSNIEFLKRLDDGFFQPGEYVYERSKGAIEHCQEHIEQMVPGRV